jgi:hypothetical protein
MRRGWAERSFGNFEPVQARHPLCVTILPGKRSDGKHFLGVFLSKAAALHAMECERDGFDPAPAERFPSNWRKFNLPRIGTQPEAWLRRSPGRALSLQAIDCLSFQGHRPGHDGVRECSECKQRQHC